MYFKNSVLAYFLAFSAYPVAIHSFMLTRQANVNDITVHKIGRRKFDQRPCSLKSFFSPQDLTDYMAKAHEEKIRAIKNVEDEKNAEIRTLRSEVVALKEKKSDDTTSTGSSVTKQSSANKIVVASTPPSSGMVVSEMSKAELAAKVVQYQQFMAKYIVEAQQQKMKAVKAAEAATAAKYEGKIALLKASFTRKSSAAAEKPDSSSTSTSASSSSLNDTTLYDKRNANVAAAGKAGKSRWGDAEVAKVKISTKDELKVKAKHQHEATNGASVNGSTLPSKIKLSDNDLYSKRNAKVAAAAAAGKSRWGSAESKKASEANSKHSLPSSASASTKTTTSEMTPIVVTPEIEAADHGLRNDGGVGGPSLAQRVNLGRQLFNGVNGATSTHPPSPVTISTATVLPSTYDLRNAKIAAAAAAGKSRWGSAENEKVTKLASNAPPRITGSPSHSTQEKEISASIVDIPMIPEVEAADHGLRSDGGVGGPSLAQRVNLGSNLF